MLTHPMLVLGPCLQQHCQPILFDAGTWQKCTVTLPSSGCEPECRRSIKLRRRWRWHTTGMGTSWKRDCSWDTHICDWEAALYVQKVQSANCVRSSTSVFLPTHLMWIIRSLAYILGSLLRCHHCGICLAGSMLMALEKFQKKSFKRRCHFWNNCRVNRTGSLKSHGNS